METNALIQDDGCVSCVKSIYGTEGKLYVRGGFIVLKGIKCPKVSS